MITFTVDANQLILNYITKEITVLLTSLFSFIAYSVFHILLQEIWHFSQINSVMLNDLSSTSIVQQNITYVSHCIGISNQ